MYKIKDPNILPNVAAYLTNNTVDQDDHCILVDSGFSGFAVIGTDTFAKISHMFPNHRKVEKSSKTTYMFGAGNDYKSTHAVRVISPLVGTIHIDLVDGDLPMLLGRAFLRLNKVKLDFDRDELEITNRKLSRLQKYLQMHT